jgi:hypothetical protein
MEWNLWMYVSMYVCIIMQLQVQDLYNAHSESCLNHINAPQCLLTLWADTSKLMELHK